MAPFNADPAVHDQRNRAQRRHADRNGGTGPLGLPFREVWCIDFEFRPQHGVEGSRPEVVCMVARELGTNRLLRLWADDLEYGKPPFDTGDDVLFVAFYNSAEWSCFLELGWPLPTRTLDLYVENLVDKNGLPSNGRGLLGVLSRHGLASITKAEKDHYRDRILAGGPFSSGERAEILSYCQGDVDPLGALLERMLPAIRARKNGLTLAMYRARYMQAVARMERVGVPVDTDTLADLRENWDGIKLGLIAEVDPAFNVYDGTTFRTWRFADYLAANKMLWPKENGRLKLDGDTFRDMSRTYPELRPLYELRHALGTMRLEKLQVGHDDRNRVLLSPYSARTGRNQPSNNRFIFGPSKWIRSLIQAPPGRALAYLDWKSQEVAIAAYLSGDEALMEAYATGDPYLTFAKMAGLAPADATKATHGAVRDSCKTVVLGANYGMGDLTLSIRLGQTTIEARNLLGQLRRTFPTYFAWCRDNQARGQLDLSMRTVFGWPLNITDDTRPNALLNFPMQGNGAEMLRLATCLATERGIDVCAPVHDAMLIEAPADDIDDTVAATAAAMREAARVVLDGHEVFVDVEKVLLPGDRYNDERGLDFWQAVQRLLGWTVAA